MPPDKKEKHDVMSDVWWFAGILAVLIVLWYFAGGPGKTDLRGIFLAPPQPLGSGSAYGPQFGSSTPDYPPPQDNAGSDGFYVQ